MYTGLDRRPRGRAQNFSVAILLVAMLVNLLGVGPARAATVGGGVNRYVMMGDSYSAGEGLSDNYYGDSNVSTNQCHRSTRAYPALLRDAMVSEGRIAEKDWVFSACSGELISDLYFGSGKDFGDGVPQLSFLNEDTRFVTLTIGGNDAGFVDTLSSCVQAVNWRSGRTSYLRGSSRQCDEAKTATDAVIGGESLAASPELGARLLAVYREVLRRAPYARLTVLTYPPLFPDRYSGRTISDAKYCYVANYKPFQFLGFSDGDVDEFRRLQRRLNQQVALAVSTLAEQGLADRISMVRLDEGEIATHTVSCGDHGAPEPYINGVLYGRDSVLTKEQSLASFHPNDNGHAAYARYANSTASTFSRPLALAVSGDTSFPVGTTTKLTLTARSGSPRWEPSHTDVNAIPTYNYGFSDVTPGLTVTGTVPNLEVTASAAGTYEFTASATDDFGDRVESVVTVTVTAPTPTPTPTPDDSTGRFYLGYSGHAAALSEDGQWFTYVQSRQVDGVQYFDLWLRSTLSGAKPIKISKNADETVTSGVQKYDAPGISDDGRYVVFSSNKPLTPEDTNTTGDVYRYDRMNDRLTLVPGTTSARSGPVSNDGRYVIILRPTSTSPLFGSLWRVDMTTGLAVRVDTTAAGANPDRTVTFLDGVQIFGDGERVLFSTSAGNLDPADTDTVADLYVKDLTTGFVEAITAGLSDTGERLTSYRGGTISSDGRLVAFPAGGVLDGQWRQLLLDRSTGEHIVVAPGSNPLRVSADSSTLAYTINHVVPGTPGVDGSPSSGYTAAHRGTVVLSPLSVVDDVNLSLNADGSEPRFSNSTPSASIVGLSATGKELVWVSTYGYMMPDVYSGGGFFLYRAP